MPDKKEQVSFATTEAAFRSLLRAYGSLKHVMEPYFATFGISGSQWGVLRILHRAKSEGPDGLRFRDIGERLLIRPPSVTGVVRRLQRLGLVDCKTSDTDSRAKKVSLTAAGNELIEQALDGHRAKISAVFGGLSSNEQSQLQQMLERIGYNLKKMKQYKDDSTVY